jgi:hypothetical protein
VTEHSLLSRNGLIILTLVLHRSISQATEDTRNRSSSSSSVSYLLDTRKVHLRPRAVDHFCIRFETGRPARRVQIPNLRYHSTNGVIVGHHLRVKESANSFVQSTDSHPAAKEIATSPANSSTPVLGRRTRKPPVRWAEESTTGIYAGLALDPDEIVEQQIYEDAIASPQQSTEWKSAMEYEMDSLIKN